MWLLFSISVGFDEEYIPFDSKGDIDDDVNFKPDDIITQLGGCGRFQIIMSVIIQIMKIVVCWVMGGNAFFAFVPRWRCVEFSPTAGYTGVEGYPPLANGSVLENGSHTPASSEGYWDQQCSKGDSQCIKFEYEKCMHTLVSEVKFN